MLGATLRVKSLVADLCRANSGVSTLVLDTNDLFIDEVLKKDRFTQKVPFSSEPSLTFETDFLQFSSCSVYTRFRLFRIWLARVERTLVRSLARAS